MSNAREFTKNISLDESIIYLASYSVFCCFLLKRLSTWSIVQNLPAKSFSLTRYDVV